MSYKRADQITVSGEWARHFGHDGKRSFWKAERKAFGEHASREAGRESCRVRHCSDANEDSRTDHAPEADGWYQVRQKGIHRQYHHASNTGTVTVAGKPSVEVPPGTLNSILKQAGLKK